MGTTQFMFEITSGLNEKEYSESRMGNGMNEPHKPPEPGNCEKKAYQKMLVTNILHILKLCTLVTYPVLEIKTIQ